MKKKLTIGLPRVFDYYKCNTMWKKYFKYLGCNIVVSSITGDEIKNLAMIINSNLEYNDKIYLGHVFYLFNKCDYVFIPKNKYIYDTIIKTFPNIRLINYYVTNLLFLEFIYYIKIGFKVNKNIFRIIYAYIKAKRKEKEMTNGLINNQKKLLYNTNKKILIISNYDFIYDKCIDDNSYNYLKENNIDLLYGNLLDVKIANGCVKGIKDYIYSKQLTGSIFYYKEAVDGIIFMKSSFDIESFLSKYQIDIPNLIIDMNRCVDKYYMIDEIKDFVMSI